MNDSTIIDQVAMERILYVIEESLKVSSQSQFYSWAQGALQGLLPHEILLCLYGDLPSSRFNCRTFSAFADDQKVVKRLTSASDGMLSSIVECWLRAGRKPLILASGKADARLERVASNLHSIGCGHAMAHGARDISDRESSFFIFLRMAQAPDTRESYLVELVMPHLHMTLCRTLQMENRSGSRKAADIGVLSDREEEVMRWVGQGKTNQEIGILLAISPLTVKNHVQKILRKLRVSNRAQAVYKISAVSQMGKQSRARVRTQNQEDGAEPGQQREPD